MTVLHYSIINIYIPKVILLSCHAYLKLLSFNKYYPQIADYSKIKLNTKSNYALIFFCRINPTNTAPSYSCSTKYTNEIFTIVIALLTRWRH